MASDINAYGLEPASTYYLIITNQAEQYANDDEEEFDTFVAGDWAEYAIGAATPNAAGDWVGSFPTWITVPGTYTVQLRLRAGGTPAVTDDLKAGPNPMVWTGTSESAFSGGSGMTVETARGIVRAMVRDGSGETVTHIDYAIQLAGDHFCRTTRFVKRTDSVAITEGSTSFPLTTPIAAGFRPERVIDVWITGEQTPVELVDYSLVARETARDDGSGTPALLAFLDNTSNAVIWRSPSDNFVAKLRYWLPFTTWTPGGTDAPTLNTTLNIPTDVIRPVLTLGAASVLKGPSPEAAFATAAWAKFEEYERQMMGAGNLGARTLQMARGVTFQNQAYPRRPLDRINWG